MKTLLLSFSLALLAINLIACDKADVSTSSDVEIILSVYDPANPGSVRSNGNFDTNQLKVFYKGEYLGETPLEFTTERLQSLKLPSYEKIHTSENSLWITWDSDLHGRLVVAMPKSPETKTNFELRSIEDDSEVLFNGFTTQPTEEGAILLSVKIKIPEEG